MKNLIKLILCAGLVSVPMQTQDQHFSISVDPKEASCIYESLWFEASGESKEGIRAVLSVIQNRVLHEQFPNSYCAVIRQHRQFSYVWQRKAYGLSLTPQPTMMHNDLANFMKSLANDTLAGKFKNIFDKDVLWYHTKNVKPKWSRKMLRVISIDNHIFWRNK